MDENPRRVRFNRICRKELISAKIITAIKNSLDHWNDRKTKMQGMGKKRDREATPGDSEPDTSMDNDNLRPRSRADVGPPLVFPTPDLYALNDFYANGMPFACAFASPYPDFSALLQSTPIQATSSGQVRFASSTSTRFEGVIPAPAESSRARLNDDDESVVGYSSESDPRIMRNFGIREPPGWK
jgi:hypothetical protein